MATSERQITENVLARLGLRPTSAVRKVAASLVKHLHDFVRDVEPTGSGSGSPRSSPPRYQRKMCDGKVRQNSSCSPTRSRVDAGRCDQTSRKPPGATESTVFGPFYIANMPAARDGRRTWRRPPRAGARPRPGTPARWPPGRERDTRRLAVAANGMYSGQDPAQPETNLRGKYTTGRGGPLRDPHHRPTSYPIPTDGPVGKLHGGRRGGTRSGPVARALHDLGARCKTL